jgi:hypothetical protein
MQMPPLNKILPPRFAAFCALFIGIARVKQTLHSTVPKPEFSEGQISRDLMRLLTWQLWLAKDLGAPPGVSPGIDPFLN